jgi:hypothetical protein
MSPYLSKRIKHAKILTASKFKFRKKYKAERHFEIGKQFFIAIVAWLLSEKAFLLGHLNSAGITVLAIVLYYIFWFFINFFKTPSIMDARLRKVIRGKGEIIYGRRKRDDLVTELESLLEAYTNNQTEDASKSLSNLIEKASTLMKESGLVSESDIYGFKDCPIGISWWHYHPKKLKEIIALKLSW